MLDFEQFWGLDLLLRDFGLNELWHLTIVHALVMGVYFIVNIFVINPLFRVIDKRLLTVSKCFSTAMLGFTIVWLIIFGLLYLLLGNELSLTRHLYVYFVMFFLCLATQIHIQIAVPNFADVENEIHGGRINERNRDIHQQ